MRTVSIAVTLSPEQMAQAKGRLYGTTLPLTLAKGSQAVAIGVLEPATQRASVARTEFEVGAAGGR
jgi:hypothetical protein